MRPLTLTFLSLTIALLSGSACADASPSLIASELPSFSTPTSEGRLPEQIDEASGIVQSAWDDDRLWVHNDSGNGSQIFAVNFEGELLGALVLPVRNRDWEEIARGPCDAEDWRRSCLYIGEIGDNNGRYDSVAIHRVREPQHLDGGSIELDESQVETMHLVYPDGPRDAEAFVVDDRQSIWILSKRPQGQTRLYTANFRENTSPRELRYVREYAFNHLSFRGRADFLTAADWDPERRIMILRLYTMAVAFLVPSGDLSDLFDLPGQIVPTGFDLQGEGIGWLRDGGYVHISEGRNVRIWKVGLQDQQPDEQPSDDSDAHDASEAEDVQDNAE